MSKILRHALLAALSIATCQNALASENHRLSYTLGFKTGVVYSASSNSGSGSQPTDPAEEADEPETQCEFTAGSTMWRVNKNSQLAVVMWQGNNLGAPVTGEVSISTPSGITYSRGAAQTPLAAFERYEVCRTMSKNFNGGTWQATTSKTSEWTNDGDPYNCSWTPLESNVLKGVTFTQSSDTCMIRQTRTVQKQLMNSESYAVKNDGSPEVETQSVSLGYTERQAVGTDSPAPGIECLQGDESVWAIYNSLGTQQYNAFITFKTVNITNRSFDVSETSFIKDGVTYQRGSLVSSKSPADNAGYDKYGVCRVNK